MIQLTPHMRILVAIQPADFRKGIDGLARLARSELSVNPFSGTVFVFHNRRRTAVKLLVYDGQGFWLCQKRLSKGHFPYWPRRSGKAVEQLTGLELQVVLCGGRPSAACSAPDWRRVEAASPFSAP